MAAKEPKLPAPPKSLKCRYVKSTQFRVMSADGMFGGITPQGLIQMSLFTERAPIPTEAEYQVTPEGGLGSEIKKGDNNGVVEIERELEVSVQLRPDTARALLVWLKG